MSDTEPVTLTDNSLAILSDENVYNELLTRSGGQFVGNEKAIKELELIYKKLHSVAVEMANAYKSTSSQYELNPGRIEVVLGGGRAEGKPFKEGSDLDIFFHIENPDQNLDSTPLAKYPTSPVDAMDEKLIKMRSLQGRIKGICKEQSIPNHFHIMGWGAPIPEKYRPENQLLLAKVE